MNNNVSSIYNNSGGVGGGGFAFTGGGTLNGESSYHAPNSHSVASRDTFKIEPNSK